MPSRNKKSGKLFMVTMSAMLSISLAACGNENAAAPAPEDNSKIVVKYKGGEITEKEFELEQKVMQFMSPQFAQFAQMDEFKEYLAKQGAAYEYLAVDASEESREAAKKQADELVDKNKEAMGAEALEAALTAQGLTEDELRSYMLRVMTVMEDQKNKVTDEEIKNTFDEQQEDFTVVTLRHVLIGLTDSEGKERTKEDALKLANEVKAKLDGGADFAEIAKEYSEDPSSQSNGGLYENYEVKDWVPEFKEKALSLPLNEVSEPVETEYGYHVMKVESREEMTFDKLSDERKDQIRSDLASSQVDEFMNTELDSIIESIELPKSETPAEPSTEQENGATQAPQADPGTSDPGAESKEPEAKEPAAEDTGK
ncbi:peptidylprolyl isomerase [Paenibacillus sp. JSM ZJ436]|uniref:peptidylprolyl isomerase n=1 Tax=Paenibacillus sp. JSM ZJ436 TaxID=3376190 RepID=UPI0037B052F9